MSNYVEYKDRVAFHPGYYIKEAIDESGLSQEDFARRLATTPKNLSVLVRGEQSLSVEMARKLSRMFTTSISYWLNLQQKYDELIAEFNSDEELKQEKEVFKYLEYNYFQKNFNLPVLKGKVDEQIASVRSFFGVATLSVLKNKDLAVSFRSASEDMTTANIIRANVMVQIAINEALKRETQRFIKKKFQSAVSNVLTLTDNLEVNLPEIINEFQKCGVNLVVLPNLSGSKINGATKRIGDHVLLMVNNRGINEDTFWFSLFHEIGHIINGDYGISSEDREGDSETEADSFAADMLIPNEKYTQFIAENECFRKEAILEFAASIQRDPGIVLGRLEKDGYVDYNDWKLKSLHKKYRFTNPFGVNSR